MLTVTVAERCSSDVFSSADNVMVISPASPVSGVILSQDSDDDACQTSGEEKLTVASPPSAGMVTSGGLTPSFTLSGRGGRVSHAIAQNNTTSIPSRVLDFWELIKTIKTIWIIK